MNNNNSHNQLSARVDSTSAFPQINFSVVVHGRMQALPREGQLLGACQAFVRGVRGHASPKKNLEWCNLVRFGAYFHKIFTFINLYKNNDIL